MSTRTRLLFIARYRNAAMHQKVELLAAQHGFEVLQVLPSAWQDELGSATWHGETARIAQLTRKPIAMRGRPNDPHRATYRTLDFGMRAFRPDLIVAEEEPDSLAALQIVAARALFARRAKLVLYTWQNVARPLSAAARGVMRATLRASDMVICANTAAVALLRAHGYAKATPLIPAIGVDTRVFYPEALPHPARTLRVGFAGRLDMNKGLATLIAACAQSRDALGNLAFAGDGPDRAQIQTALKDNDLTSVATLHGALTPEQLAAFMRSLDVLVLASRSTPVWKEQFGRVLTEAMACGACVVGSDSGAIPEVIGDAGLTFPEGDATQLAERLKTLARDVALRHTLRARGLQRVSEHYSNERIAARTASSVRTLLSP